MSNGLLPLDRAVAQSHADGRGEHNKRPSSFYSAPCIFYYDFALHVYAFFLCDFTACSCSTTIQNLKCENKYPYVLGAVRG